jgi:hypothetical protein
MEISGIKEIYTPVNLNMINWNGPIYKISTIGDGSCFFHSILRAFHSPYIRATDINFRIAEADKLREALAIRLEEKDPITGKIFYDTLGEGGYAQFSQVVPAYSLQSMCKELRSRQPVDTAYQELFATAFGYDIYIIDAKNGDVLPTTNGKNLYKNRLSIFIYGSEGHYETLCLKTHQKDVYAPLLTADHSFTQCILNRIKKLEHEDN